MKYSALWLHVILLILAVSIGTFLRLYKIQNIPYGINHDGAWSGLWAIELSQKPWPLQIYSDQGWLGEAMPRYVIALFIKILGPTMLALKLGMMVFTIIALPIFYLMVKEMFGRQRLALLSTFLLASSGWDITYGKTGWRVSSVPLFVILTMYFLLKSLKTNNWLDCALTGIFAAAAMNTYNAGQFIPFTIIGLLLFHLYQKRKNWKKFILPYLTLGVFFLIFVTPLTYYALTHWENYTGRARFLSVFGKISREKSLYPAWENIKYAALMYTVKGHFGADFYLKEPLLDPPVSWLFLTGTALTFIKLKKTPYFYLVFLFFTSLIPSLLGNPDGGHAIGTLPAVYIISGLGLEAVFSLLSMNKKLKRLYLPQLICGLLIGYAVLNTYKLYLGPNRHIRWGFYPETTAVAYYMKPRIKDYDIYLTDNFPRDILTYLTYQRGNPWERHYTWFEKGEEFLEVVQSPDKGLIFIMSPGDWNQDTINKLKQKYSQGKFTPLHFQDDSIKTVAAWIYTVDKPTTIDTPGV